MHTFRIALLFTAAAGLTALANPEAQEAVSTRNLNAPTEVLAQAAPQRVHLHTSCAGQVEAGEAWFIQPECLHTIRIPVRNISESPLTLRVSTDFIKADGAAVENTCTVSTGGFEGMARGFLGVLSLGASEMAMENQTPGATIATTHVLAPGQEMIVEHRLPFVCDQAVAARSEVSVATPAAQTERSKEMHRAQKKQYWKARDTYFEDRLSETQRWEDQRNLLDQERSVLEPQSEDYGKAMNAYWQAQKSHESVMNALEAKFSSFALTQERAPNPEKDGKRP